jgi:hypothetical protein
MNSSSPERISRNPCKQKGSLNISAAQLFMHPGLFVPITIAHPSFTSWWQELHDHIFNVPVHPLCLELMPDFHPISEVINLFPSFFNHAPLY